MWKKKIKLFSQNIEQMTVWRTVLCERRKTFFNLYSKALFVSSVGARKKKLYFIFWFCIQTNISSWVLMWKEENIFILNLTFSTFHSLYGAKKIFHSIVGSNAIAWAVRVWKEKVLEIGYISPIIQRGI